MIGIIRIEKTERLTKKMEIEGGKRSSEDLGRYLGKGESGRMG